MTTTRRRFLAGAIGAAAAVATGARTGAAGRPSPTARASRPGQRGPSVQVVPIPDPPVPPQNWTAGTFVSRVDVPSPMMAFTFDDGPSPYNTDPMLFALDQAGVKATFFMIGVNVRAWPDIARRVRDAGHEIGNHSVYHTPYRASALASQIGPNQLIINDAVGLFPVANRAPGLTRGWQILGECAAHNLYECHTDRTTSDWRAPRWPAWRLIDQFRGVLHPGLIGLYHDGGPRRPTVDALPTMMSIAQSNAYALMSVTDMVNIGVPRPGGADYRGAFADSFAATPNDGRATDDETVEITCNYDPKAEMLVRLDDPTTKRAERSRIVEVLADIEANDQQSAEDAKAFDELNK